MSGRGISELSASSLMEHNLHPIKESSPALSPPKPQPIEVSDDGTEDLEPKIEDPNRLAEAKVRHEADLKKHHYEAPKADRIQDDWQVAYAWAFIVKFEQLNHIRKLECLEDFERSLSEPVANRPDDVLEGILIRFLSNLKPGLRNLDCTNIQHHLSGYISDMLRESPEFTVWDRPWAPNEEARGSCCNQLPERSELGRLRYPGEPLGERVKKNPILQMEERGGGLFELDWRERAKLLRQLVDWQLSHSENIRGVINKEYKVETKTAKKNATEGQETSVATVPLGQDRDKARIWAFDHSGRLYKSGNPFKRPCPLYSITSTRDDLNSLLEKYRIHGFQTPGKVKGSGPKGKPTGGELTAHRKILKGIEDERKLAEKIEEMVPLIEKEEARVQRARRKIIAAQELAQMADFRSTRTRRRTKKVDYSYEEDGFESDGPASKRQRNETAGWEGSSTRGRPIIPGERRSARVTVKEQDQPDHSSSVNDMHRNVSNRAVTPLTATAPVSAASNGRSATAETTTDMNGNGSAVKKRKNRMKGYAWVEEFVPLTALSPKDLKEAERRAREEREEQIRKEQLVTATTAPTTADGSSSPLSGTKTIDPENGNDSSRLSSVAPPPGQTENGTIDMDIDEL